MSMDDIRKLRESALKDMRRGFDSYARHMPYTLKESLALHDTVKNWHFLAPDIAAAMLPGGVRAIWRKKVLYVWPQWADHPYKVIPNSKVEMIPNAPLLDEKVGPDEQTDFDTPEWGVDFKSMTPEQQQAFTEGDPPPSKEPKTPLEVLFVQAEKDGAFGPPLKEQP